MIKLNNKNPISTNLVSDVNLNNQTPKNTNILNIVNHLNNQVPTTNNQVNLNNQNKVNLNNQNKVNLNNQNQVNLNNQNQVNLNNQNKVNLNNQNKVNLNNQNKINLNNQNKVNLNNFNSDIDSDNVNYHLNKLGNMVVNINTNANLDVDKVGEINKSSPCHSCLLENCPCETIGQQTCCNSINTNSTPCGNCPTSDYLNGKKVNKECIKNNTINYADVFNRDAPKDNISRCNIPNTDCAFDSSCVTPAYIGTLHFSTPNQNTNSTNFWTKQPDENKSKDSQYIQRDVPRFKCN